jgi:hypothetical protein
LWPAVVVVLILCFAAVSGLAIGLLGVMAMAASVAVVIALLSMILPVRHLIVLLFVTAFLIMGQAMYFAGIAKAFWMPLMLGMVLLIRLPAELMRRNPELPNQAPFQPMQSAAVRVAIAVYFSTLVATALINLNPGLQIFVSGKEYVFLWGLYLVIATGLVHPSLLQKIWNALPWLLPLQLPFIFYQRFFVAARRLGLKIGAAWDAVVGAFGGDPQSGGMSGAMGIFVVIFMTLSIVRWRKSLLPAWQCAVFVASGLIAILLAEVKFAVLVLPIAIAVAYLREFLRRPVMALGAMIVSGALAAGLLYAYDLQYSDSHTGTRDTYAETMFTSSFSGDFVNMETGEMGRVAAITFWGSEQKNVVETLIGHGMGSSRKGGTVVGEAAKRYPFDIARSSLAILLWETGLIGTLVFIVILLGGAARAYVLADNEALPEHERAVLNGIAAGFCIIFMGLPYNTDALYSPQIQCLMMLSLGQIAMSGGLAKAKRHNISGGADLDKHDLHSH